MQSDYFQLPTSPLLSRVQANVDFKSSISACCLPRSRSCRKIARHTFAEMQASKPFHMCLEGLAVYLLFRCHVTVCQASLLSRGCLSSAVLSHLVFEDQAEGFERR
jgi:hypothetical protein